MTKKENKCEEEGVFIFFFYTGTTKGEIDAIRSCGNLLALVYVDGNMVDVSSEDSSFISY